MLTVRFRADWSFEAMPVGARDVSVESIPDVRTDLFLRPTYGDSTKEFAVPSIKPLIRRSFNGSVAISACW